MKTIIYTCVYKVRFPKPAFSFRGSDGPVLGTSGPRIGGTGKYITWLFENRSRTLRVSQKSKYCLFPSVRTIFFCASYGAPRSIFCLLQHLYGNMLKKKRAYFVRGVVKLEILLISLRKNDFFSCFLWSVALDISHFDTPLRWNAYFF